MFKFILVFLFLSSCAFGRTYPDGTVVGFAIGHAEVRSCHYSEDVPCDADEVFVCDQIRGGYFSTGFAGLLEAAVAAVIAYFTAGTI